MEALEAIRQALTLTELTKASFILFILTQGFGSFVLSQGRAAFLKDNTRLFSKSIKIAGFFFLFILSRSWLALVDKYVPEPYLVRSFQPLNEHNAGHELIIRYHRMRCSILPKRKHTARGASLSGTTR